MTENRKSLYGRNNESRKPQPRDARKAIDKWEDEGGSLPAATDVSDLKNSTLADNAGWRADRVKPIGSKNLSGTATGRRESHRAKFR